MPAETMSPQIAINNINSVVRAYKGTRDEHDILQQSVETLQLTLNENLKEMESLASELEEARVQIRTLQAELAEHEKPEEATDAEPAPLRAPVRLEGTPRPTARPARNGA